MANFRGTTWSAPPSVAAQPGPFGELVRVVDRTRVLEGQMATLQTTADAATQRLDDLTPRVDAMTKQTPELARQIKKLAKDQAALDAAIQALRMQVSQHEQRLDRLESAAVKPAGTP